jgi:multiple sugar transport system substrate-binding protein
MLDKDHTIWYNIITLRQTGDQPMSKSALLANIDRNSPIPIYHQLKTLIREHIASGVWRPGDSIPTEHELCQLYDISRSPVRQALSELAREGILVRRPGRGTFVHEQATVRHATSIQIQVMSSDPYWAQVLDHVADTWNKAHPDQAVAFRIDVVDHSQFHNLLSTAVGSGTAPDVAMVDSVWVAGLAQAGFLYALDELDSAWDYAKFVRGLHPAFVKANSFGDKLFGIPLKADASLLWYRKDWFEREDLVPPQDWNDLVTTAEHFLVLPVQEQYGLEYPLAFPGGTAGGEATVYSLMPFIWSAGGDIFDPAAEHIVLNSPSTRQALQFVRELTTLHHVTSPEVTDYGEHTTLNMLVSGKVAMALGGSHESDVILDLGGWKGEEFSRRIGYVASPPAPSNSQTSTVGGTSYVILRQSSNPTLISDVLKLAVRPGTVGELYRSLMQNSPYLSFDGFINPKADPLLTQVSRLIASGRARPSTPEYFKVSRQLQIMFESVISGTQPIDRIVQRTAEFLSVITELPCQST